MTKQELIEGIKAHARKNYEKGGWDYVIECYSDEDIAHEIEGATTLLGAIRKLSKSLKDGNDYRRDIQAEAF